VTKLAITTHVLDVARGRPGSGIAVRLEQRADTDAWREIGAGITGADGRVELLSRERLVCGAYRLRFDTGRYLAEHHGTAFYPDVTVAFAVESSDQHYHLPLLLSPFGYSTYRGS